MIDVGQSRELQAALLSLKDAEQVVATDINREARGRVRPLWEGALSARAKTSMERAVILPGARANANRRGIRVQAATSRRPLRGGLVPTFDWPGVEFGARSRWADVAMTSPKGTRYTARKRINRQFRSRQSHGRIAFDAASDIVTKVVGIWVETIVAQYKSFADIKGGR